MNWGQPRTSGTIITGSLPGIQTKNRTGHARRSDGTSSSSGSGTLRFGSPVAVEGSFQAFLAEQTNLQATAATAPQSAPAPIDHTASATTQGQKNTETAQSHHRRETPRKLARDLDHLNPAVLLRSNKSISPGKPQAGTETRSGEHSLETATPDKEVVAGWYGPYHHGRLMANGRRFNMHAATLAHRNMPIGTKVELENPKTGEKARAVVTDRGPYHHGRDVDLSYGLAKRLSLTKQGVGNLKMRVL